ncbi:MAG: nucleotide exchange factor GrpE [Anaerolineae bacterium]|jgi:molecular chaperone GrpE
MYWDERSWPARRIPVRVVEDEDTPASLAEQSGQVIETNRESSTRISDEIVSPTADEPDWQALALRLQADMGNFRKRQTRRADEAIDTERERLLRLILPVTDNLARALSHDGQEDKSLRQGVELTFRELMRMLRAEGVTRIEALGQPFTPELHEAVATIATNAKVGTIVEEVEAGYKLGNKLLRPARVVVAA